jgi:hypothetical protein
VDLSNINNDVHQQLTTQAPANPQIEPTALSPEQAELERLRVENAQLKQSQLDAERDKRIKSAVAASNVQDSGPTSGEMSVRRTRAIAQAGNVARWYKIPVTDRVNILLDGQRVAATPQEIAKYFGPKSSAAAATQLKATNPRAYLSYRSEAVELGLI